jgi:hypothetical protein
MKVCYINIIIVILLLMVIFNLNCNSVNKSNKENFINTSSNKSLKNIKFKEAPTATEKLVFSDTDGNLKTYNYDDSFTNGIPVKTWKIYEDANKNLCFKQNDATNGICLTNNNTNSSIKLSGNTLDELSLKKTKHLNNFAGWGIDGAGSTQFIYVGRYNLHTGEWGDAYSNDQLNVVYVNKGFKITFYQHSFAGLEKTYENTDSDIPKRFSLDSDGLGDSASSIKAEWIGYETK